MGSERESASVLLIIKYPRTYCAVHILHTVGLGVLEFWSIGVLEKAKTEDAILNNFFITPPLHYSSRLAWEVETPEAPLEAAQSRILWAWILYCLVPSDFIKPVFSSN